MPKKTIITPEVMEATLDEKKKITLLDLSFGRQDLNQMADKINEIITEMNK